MGHWYQMDEFETLEFDESKALKITKIIWFYMLFGLISFTFICIFLHGAPQLTNLNLFPVGFGIIMMFTSVVSVLTVFRNPTKQLAKFSSEESLLKYYKNPKELKDAPKTPESFAFREWQSNCIIRLTILEGGALFNILGVFLESNVHNFACAGVLVAFMILLFPSKYLWESYRNERVHQLLSDGWQSPQSSSPVA